MRFLAVVPFAMMISAPCFSAGNSNPFVALPAPDQLVMNSNPAATLDEPLPQSFTENRSVFDMIEVVGRAANSAVLRIPITSVQPQSGMAVAGGAMASAQGISYRQVIAKNGRDIFVGGRLFKVTLPADGTLVVLADKRGRVAWEGDLQGPKVFNVSPNMADYQYSPPLSAGKGIVQSTSSSAALGGVSGQAAGQPAAPGGQPPGMSGASGMP